MIRALWFFAKVGAAIAAAVWLVRRPGEVSVSWFGYRLETSVGIALLAVAVLLALCLGLYKAAQALAGTPRRFRRYRRSRNRELGYRALTEGFVAIAAGDATQARRLAGRAEKLLGAPSLSLLLTAQAAQLEGDSQTAGQAFAGLLERPDAAFLGARGLISDALRRGDTQRALRMARRARSLKPNSGWTLVTLFDLEVRAHEWDRAGETLAAAVRAGAIAKDTARRHRAALSLAQSLEQEGRANPDSALTLAERAHEMLPSFPPTALRAGRLLARKGRQGRAVRTVERSWGFNPHPDLAQLWGELGPTDPIERYKWFERLHAARRDPEGRLASGAAALDSKLWGEARSHLVAALEGPSARSRAYRLLARLEREERQDEGAAREWLARIAEAAPDPAWTCSACNARNPFWTPACEVCGTFDSLEWRSSDMPIQLPQRRNSHTMLTVPPLPPTGPLDIALPQAGPAQ